MKESARRAVAIVAAGAILPDAPNAQKFWQNIKEGRYSITEVTPDRWSTGLYYDPDPAAPDKTYSKIGGWCREWEWDPLKWRMPIPPRVAEAMDLTQKWAVVTAREVLNDYGYPARPLNPERTAVILGNAMGGDQHLYSAARILFPDYADELAKSAGFSALPAAVRETILQQFQQGVGKRMPRVTEDTMPGELSNIIAGRLAALFDFKGPNFVTDAACASALAAISSAIEGLVQGHYDAVITGGVDANMSPSTFVKFCKIGALSATGSRPYAEGADGFVMGEGAAVFLLKRLSDAERDGDRIYAVIRGWGGSSDGKGKGITAPNPVGQKLCVRRAWENAGVPPSAGDMIEGHGTSTRVGDVAELNSLIEAIKDYNLPAGSLPLGSVKSNIGHLKGGAGAAGILKAMFALHEKVLPPSLNFLKPNPDIDFKHSPLYVNTELKPWEKPGGEARRAGVSSFGFGGTNFHFVLEEYVPGGIIVDTKATVSVPENIEAKTPLRGALVLGADSESALANLLDGIQKQAAAGIAPRLEPPSEKALRAPVRLTIDYADAPELADKAAKALKAFAENQPGRWKALRAKGIFLGKGPAPKVAFLFTGQGSQYVNMLRSLRSSQPIVTDTFDEADRVMTPLLGKSLSECIFLDEADEKALAAAEEGLKQTAITQPAVLATETALARMLGAYGIKPDMVMGHSLGEYGALVAADALSYAEALRAVSARGAEMTRSALEDNGVMAAVFGPIPEIEKILAGVEGYVVIANINSSKEAVIGGATAAVEKAIEAVRAAGYVARQLQVSHAFHTSIVAGASEGLSKVLAKMDLKPPSLPIVSNVTGEFYPMGPGVVPQMIHLLGKQVSSPVQFVKGLNTLYDAGARVFVEVGPKRVLYGFVEDVLGEREGVYSLFTNHPRIGEAESLNLALCGLYAAGLGNGTSTARTGVQAAIPAPPAAESRPAAIPSQKPAAALMELKPSPAAAPPVAAAERYMELGRLFAEVLERGNQIYFGAQRTSEVPRIGITGASLGLPGVDRVFDDTNVERILRGDQFIESVPVELRRSMLEKNITRLVKSVGGEGHFETIESLDDVIKLASRSRNLDLVRDFGFPEDRLPALDHVTRLAIGAGIDALRDAGIPLVMRYKTTTKGTKLPDRWGLPDQLRDDTGILFTSAFPGYSSYEEIISGFYQDRIRKERLADLGTVRDLLISRGGTAAAVIEEIDRRIADLRSEIEKNPYHFDRRFLFRVLSMGHSQFAEYIGARGPNTSTNAACASGTQAVAIARDWIATGRCRRVIIISADDITSDNLMGWFAPGFLASGTAATDEKVEEAATPFDRRRHGLIIGMGASAMVLETLESAQERGVQPICELLSSVAANSAFHGTRLDVSHICQVMEQLISQAEAQWGINRFEIAPQTVFVSHETYTPARGGSASAEVFALRHVFKDAVDKIIIANTKGATGHPMAVGVEDVVAVKILETGVVPPVPNFKEVDPELGLLNLSKGGSYPVQYALRLGAGFGSQICMTLTRWVPTPTGVRQSANALGYQYRISNPAAWNSWLQRISGYEKPQIEVVGRTLRTKNEGPPAYVAPAFSAREAASPTLTAKAPAMLPPPPPARGAAAELMETPPAPPAPEPAAPSVPAKDAVQSQVMEIIASKTGYPTDMLDLDLDMEADLGIDTVKQAEMFAAIREAYNIPREDSLKLRDFPTLAHVLKFVYDRRPDLKAQPAAAPAPVVAEAAAPVSAFDATAAAVSAPSAAGKDMVAETVLKIIAEKTGYPTDMLDLDLDLEADLGIDTVKQAEMFAAIRAAYDIPREDALKLRDFPTLAHTIKFVYDRRPDLKAPSAPAAPLPAAPAPIVAPPEAAAKIEAASQDEPVKAKVMQIIAEETGYPTDMLVLDLDLEADLGIDTVKQAEMFAAIRAEYDIPREDTLKLRDFPTLAHTIQFVYDRRPDLKPAAAPVAPAVAEPIVPQKTEPATTTPKTVAATPAASMEAANSIPRRVPVPRLRPALNLCKTTGITLNEASRVVVMPDQGGVAKALLGRLEKMGVKTLVVNDAPDGDTLTQQIESWKAEGPIQGVYWLPALDYEGNLAKMDITAWRQAIRVRVKLLYATMRALYDQAPGTGGAFLVSATRLGGLHGYGEERTLAAPMGGAVTGFTKAYKREKGGALVKAVDFAESRKTAALADLLIDETLYDPGVVEVGYWGERRWTIGLEEKPAVDGKPGIQLNKDTVFLITGAAGSIVSAITADLAAASGGTFYLLDLAPKPDPANAELQKFATDKETLKRDIFERLKMTGQRVTPAMVDKEIAGLERMDAALRAIRAVEAAGGAARYYSVNLLDTAAVAGIMKEVSQQSGRIDVLVHAAGLEISRLLPEKKPSEYDLVFDVKSDGWFNILSNLGDMPLHSAVVFSSIAGRFGNAGQTDYSAANDLLCKYISSFRTTKPNTHGIAIDWTAWGGIGMASRGSIPTIMKQAGIDMLPPEAGIPTVRRELTAGGTTGEVVVAQSLGMMVQEFDETGGLNLSQDGPVRAMLKARGFMTQKVLAMGLYGGLTIETTLDPSEQPFLYDHQINGTPVLPGVMGIEALVEAAGFLFPDLHVGAVENVKFLTPFKYYRGQPRKLTLRAEFAKNGSETVACCSLLGTRMLHGHAEPEVTTHFTAAIRLLARKPVPLQGEKPARLDNAKKIAAADIYKLYFHGPAYQVLESSWKADSRVVGLYSAKLPPDHVPPEIPMLASPRLIELCFQTASLWELAGTSRMGLPYGVERVEVFAPAENASGRLYAIVTPDGHGKFDAQVVDEKGKVMVALKGYQTMALPDSVDESLLKPIQAVLGS